MIRLGSPICWGPIRVPQKGCSRSKPPGKAKWTLFEDGDGRCLPWERPRFCWGAWVRGRSAE